MHDSTSLCQMRCLQASLVLQAYSDIRPVCVYLSCMKLGIFNIDHRTLAAFQSLVTQAADVVACVAEA